MKHFFINYFHFSRKERIGILFLTIICAAIFAFPYLMRRLHKQEPADFSAFRSDIDAFRQAGGSAAGGEVELFEFDPNDATENDLIRLGLSEKVARIICNYRDKGGKFRKPEDLKKIWSLPAEDYERLKPYIRIGAPEHRAFAPAEKETEPEYFPFDPNLASEQEFIRLGLPGRTIKSILNYRSKGGRFRNAADFRKIYTLEEKDYLRLAPYIAINVDQAQVASKPVSYSGNTNPKIERNAPNSQLDINLATEEMWRRLPGIGEKRARQIVKFRNALGGFFSVEQISEMYGLPDSVFQRIRPLVVFRNSEIRYIDLNTADIAALKSHPYISEKQARLIVAYRDQHGPYTAVDDLSKIAAFNDRHWLEKIKPYLTAR
ncbi:MAG: helix-hairpin-helix domain-containing protein [Saprospiraceae bacterium]